MQRLRCWKGVSQGCSRRHYRRLGVMRPCCRVCLPGQQWRVCEHRVGEDMKRVLSKLGAVCCRASSCLCRSLYALGLIGFNFSVPSSRIRQYVTFKGSRALRLHLQSTSTLMMRVSLGDNGTKYIDLIVTRTRLPTFHVLPSSVPTERL